MVFVTLGVIFVRPNIYESLKVRNKLTAFSAFSSRIFSILAIFRFLPFLSSSLCINLKLGQILTKNADVSQKC